MEAYIKTGAQNVDERVTFFLSFGKRSATMYFYTVRDFRTSSKKIWDNLSQEGEAVITNNGKPIALLLDIRDGGFEETLKAIRQAKAMMAFNQMREIASSKGYLSEEEIEKEIALARKERGADEGRD